MKKLVNCKACGKEVARGAKCPNCGKDQRNFFMRHKILTCILIIFILGIIGSMGSQNAVNLDTKITTENIANTTKAEPVKSIEPAKPKFEVQNINFVQEKYTGYIEGVLINNTNKNYGYLQITFNLYDKDGIQVGSTMTNVNNVEPNGKWKFKAIVLQDTAVSCKVIDITGF